MHVLRVIKLIQTVKRTEKWQPFQNVFCDLANGLIS